MASITTLTGSDGVTTANTMTKVNTNFANLNSDKIETSTLDTDTSLTANSDSKIATQKAVKAYVDSGGNQNASETTRGIVQEATDAQVTAGTATGSTGAKLFVTPAKLETRITSFDTVTISLSSAQLLALWTTPILAVAGVAGKIVQLLGVVYSYSYGSATYTNGDKITVKEETSATALHAGFNINGVGASIISTQTPTSAVTRVSGKGVYVYNAGTENYITGNGTVKLIITYRMVTI
jgi:hypothetical protein